MLIKTLIPLLLVLPVAAAPKLPPELPPFGQDKALPVPQVVQSQLPNGLQVWVLPRQGLPRVDFVLALRGAGFGADPVDRPGAAKLLAGLFNEGTAKYSSREIAEAAQALGGAVGAAAGHDGLSVYANALASQAEAMSQLLAEVALRPAFPEQEVALAKANALQALKVASAQPGFRAQRALAEAVFGDHPYARTQETEASIQAIDAAWLRAEHARRLRPDRALLVITGRVTPAQGLQMASAAFGAWKAEGEPLPELAAAPTHRPPQRLLLERPGSVQATLRMGRPAPAADAAEQPALRLAGTILGGSFSSRVNMNLREEKGYTYGASAGARGHRAGGLVSGGADVRNEVTAAAIGEFVKEFRRLGEEPVSAEELAMNKRFLAGSYLLGMQMQASVAQALAANWLVGLPAEHLARYVPSIQALSAEQVQATARKYFNPDEQSWVVVGDKAQLDAQLKTIGDFSTRP